MTLNQLIAHFGSVTEVARALGLKVPSVVVWDTVPWLRQLQVEDLTKGKLRHDPNAIPERYRKYIRAPKRR